MENEEQIGYEECILTIEEFQEEIQLYNFYNGDYYQYVSEQYDQALSNLPKSRELDKVIVSRAKKWPWKLTLIN